MPRRPIEPAARLDTVGLYCPVPILKTARKIREIGPGDVLEIVSDDPVILEDMPAWCRSNGHEYLGAEGAPDPADDERAAGDGKELRLWVRRTR